MSSGDQRFHFRSKKRGTARRQNKHQLTLNKKMFLTDNLRNCSDSDQTHNQPRSSAIKFHRRQLLSPRGKPAPSTRCLTQATDHESLTKHTNTEFESSRHHCNAVSLCHPCRCVFTKKQSPAAGGFYIATAEVFHSLLHVSCQNF